jgi:solute carrier family 25 folate transporter 32
MPFAGLTPALIGSGLAWGVYFFAYNAAKQRYRELTGHTRLGPLTHLASAAEAGSIVCFITNPIWVVKTRLQLQKQIVLQSAGTHQAPPPPPAVPPVASKAMTSSSIAMSKGVYRNNAGAAAGSIPRPLASNPNVAYRGFVDCLTQIAKTEGLPGLYKGLLPSLFLVSHGAIQFAVYEELKTAAFHIRDFIRPLGANIVSEDKTLSSAEITACGALSKMAASIVTYPSQVVRSRLQQRMESRALQYKGVVDVLRKTMAREGVGGLYKGLVPNVLRVMPQSAMTFLVYETVMRHLQNISSEDKT